MSDWKSSPAFDTAADLFLLGCILAPPLALAATITWAAWRIARA